MVENRDFDAHIREAVRELSRQYGIPESQLWGDSRIINIQDSLDLVEVVMEFEEEFDRE